MFDSSKLLQHGFNEKRPNLKIDLQADVEEADGSTRMGYMMTSSNWSFFRDTGLLCGDFTGRRWIPLTKGQ